MAFTDYLTTGDIEHILTIAYAAVVAGHSPSDGELGALVKGIDEAIAGGFRISDTDLHFLHNMAMVRQCMEVQ